MRFTLKNFLSLLAGACVVVLAIIPLLVATDHLSWTRWKILVVLLALIALAALFAQSSIQSREDGERDERERKRDERQDAIDAKIAEMLTALKKGTPPPIDEQPAMLSAAGRDSADAAKKQDLDGEVYRLAKNPRGWSWKFLRDIYKLQGRPDEATIDTDILIEMYLVNRISDKPVYIRDLRLSAEIDGKRVNFSRQNDLSAADFNDQNYEYCLRTDGIASPLKQLFDSLPLTLAPGQPLEGWVRCMAKDINPDKIVEGTIQVTVIDSLGKEYPIVRVPKERERGGGIALCRVRE